MKTNLFLTTRLSTDNKIPTYPFVCVLRKSLGFCVICQTVLSEKLNKRKCISSTYEH